MKISIIDRWIKICAQLFVEVHYGIDKYFFSQNLRSFSDLRITYKERRAYETSGISRHGE